MFIGLQTRKYYSYLLYITHSCWLNPNAFPISQPDGRANPGEGRTLKGCSGCGWSLRSSFGERSVRSRICRQHRWRPFQQSKPANLLFIDWFQSPISISRMNCRWIHDRLPEPRLSITKLLDLIFHFSFLLVCIIIIIIIILYIYIFFFKIRYCCNQLRYRLLSHSFDKRSSNNCL